MDSLKPESNVKRQGTFETEPADTVVGRSIKRGDINLPFIDAGAVKNGTQESKAKDAIKQEQLKTVREKEQKEKELRALKEKKEKELKSLKERELKKEQLNKINHDKGSKDTVQSQKDKELKALKEKEAKVTASRDAKERELKAKKENELKAKREKELKEQQEKATKLKEEKEKQIKANEKGKKLAQANQKSGRVDASYQNGSKSTPAAKGMEGEEKVGFFQRLGRSLSPSKNKQTPPVDTTDPVPSTKSTTNVKGDKSPPQVLVVDDDRFAEVRVATPTTRSSENKEETAHFKAAPPRKYHEPLKSDTDQMPSESHKNDSGPFSERADRRAKPRVVQSKMDAWMNEKRGSQGSVDSQKMLALRKLNINSPRNSLPDDEEIPVIKDSKENKLKSKATTGKSPRKHAGDISSSLESDSGSTHEPYDNVLAERDCLLTAEVAYKRRIQQLEGETNQLAEALDKRDNEIKELKWNLENTSSVNEVTVMTQKLQNEVDKLQKELDELKKEKKKYKILHQDSERKMTEVVKENDELREKMILFEQDRIPQLEDLQKENKKLESSLKQLKTKLKESEEQFDFLKNENIEMSGEVRARQNEVQELLIALKSQKTSELDILKAKSQVENRLQRLEGLDKELADAVAKTAIVEAEKEHMQTLMKEKEKEVKSIQDQLDSKDNDVGNQTLAIELQKEEIDNLKEDIEKHKKDLEKAEEMKKEIAELKARVKSLQSELEDAQAKTKNLDEEVEDGKRKISRIQEHVKTAAETNETLRKAEKDLEATQKEKQGIETDLKISKDEISKLQQQNMELNIKIGNLNDRLKFLEDTNQKNFNKSRKALNQSDADDKLLEENRRLRLKLVEKNFGELTGDEDKNALTSRLQNLERKQIDNDVKVQQLQGWMDEISTDPPSHRQSPSVNPNPRATVATHSDKGPSNKNKKTKGKKTRDAPVGLLSKQVDPRVTVSLGDIRIERQPSRSSTPSLPMIQDIPEQTPLYNSYFYIYKQKQKLMRQQQKIR